MPTTMTTHLAKTIVVTGATGRQGGAVARQLLKDGWRVRAITRNASRPQARALADLGAEVVQGDMAARDSLVALFKGAHGVYSVQNPMISGHEGEIRQGQNVADVSREAGVRHLVYGSAAPGKHGTGVGSWESKLEIEAHMRQLGLPVTILRPMAFMELMIDKSFYPAASTWHVMPKLMGESRPLGWLCMEDLGIIAAHAFADPDRFVGEDIQLASDVQTIDGCRAIYRDVVGKAPPRWPMPVWLFQRFVGTDLTTMWRWLATHEIDLDTGPTKAIHGGTLSIREWLSGRRPAR
jgi:uncharacterized protein YbjT (DUF2867 family)